MPHRCASGCKDTSSVMHVFPNPQKFPERFQAWVQLIGGKLESASDYELYKKKRVCDIHFIDHHRNRFKRLNALAVPTLNLPGSSSSPQTEITATTTEEQPATSTNVCSTFKTALCTSQPCIEVENKNNISTAPPSTTASKAPCASKLCNVVEVGSQNTAGADFPFTTLSDGQNIAAAVLKEHNYNAKLQPIRRTLKDAVRTTSFNYAYLKQMKTKIKYLQTEICRLRKKAQSFKQRLTNAQKLSDDVAFQKVTKNMTKPSRLFVHMQQQTIKKSKGRRFSMEEKILSLSLFKKSPKCYRLLCKYFALPSSKAMKRLLSKVKLTPGINPIIFEKIKKGMVASALTLCQSLLRSHIIAIKTVWKGLRQ